MRLTYEIKLKDDGKTIKRFLFDHNISRKLLISIKHRGGTILVNGKPEKVVYRLQEGDLLIVRLPEETPSENLTPNDLSKQGYPLDIVYEDEFILVINKQQGLPCIPNMRYKDQTLANSIMHYYKQINQKATVHFISRLDKDTSGLLIVAKNRYIHHLMNDKTKIKRKYVALVENRLTERMVIMDAITKVENHPVKRKTTTHEGGKSAQTIVSPITTFLQHTLIECELLTGRTHQIRVHLSSKGYPLIGDSLYGGSTELITRQALHSYKLAFNHPITGELHQYEIELPLDVKDILKRLKPMK